MTITAGVDLDRAVLSGPPVGAQRDLSTTGEVAGILARAHLGTTCGATWSLSGIIAEVTDLARKRRAPEKVIRLKRQAPQAEAAIRGFASNSSYTASRKLGRNMKKTQKLLEK